MKTVRLKIAGKVQGVFFRATARDIASKYEIFGWIKNTFDDRVEAMITGDDRNIEKFIEWCKLGPEKAIVTSVEIREEPLQLFKTFDIIR